MLLGWSQLLETLPLPNIKWICPTAPTRPVAIFGGHPCTAWFDVGDLSGDGPNDLEGLDASAAHVANLLSTEPANIKLGIGGFSMGAATALYSATCHILGKYGNGNLYPDLEEPDGRINPGSEACCILAHSAVSRLRLHHLVMMWLHTNMERNQHRP
ncbi:hypothetical protein SCA6_011370 [Theobroma cacao]